MHTRVHPTSVGTAKSCGTAIPVTAAVELPCAQTPLTAHGSPTTTHHDHQESLSFQQKPAPHPAKTLPSHVQHHKQPHPPDTPTTPHTKIGRIPPRDRSDSARPTRRRDAHDELESEGHMPRTSEPPANSRPAEPDRSRRGDGPISTRVSTDLGAEYDRSRAGERPISAQPFLTVTFERDVCTS